MHSTQLPARIEYGPDAGKYPAYAWPGGYTLIYFSQDGSVFCADCASQDDAEPPIIGCDTYDGGPDMYCDGCGTSIESSYGDPDACPDCNGKGYESFGPLNLNCPTCRGTGVVDDDAQDD